MEHAIECWAFIEENGYCDGACGVECARCDSDESLSFDEWMSGEVREV